MNPRTLMSATLLITATVACAHAEKQAGPEVSADELGLTKGSVFETPTPQPFAYHEGMPGSPDNPDLRQAFPGAPAQIPHDISAFTPVTAKNNQCLACHNNPSGWGKSKHKGTPTPIPKSHYTDPAYGRPEAGLAGKSAQKISGARYICTQCHAPQANVKPLVTNTFGPAQ